MTIDPFAIPRRKSPKSGCFYGWKAYPLPWWSFSAILLLDEKCVGLTDDLSDSASDASVVDDLDGKDQEWHGQTLTSDMKPGAAW